MQTDMLKFILHIWLILYAHNLCVAKSVQTSIIIRHFDCEVNSKYVSQFICKTLPPRNRSVTSSFTLIKKVANLMGNIEVSISARNKKHFQRILDVTFELCKTLQERKRRTLIELLHLLPTMGNKPFQCPFNEGVYNFPNTSIADYLPSVISDSEVIAHFNWFVSKNEPVLNVSIHGRLFQR